MHHHRVPRLLPGLLLLCGTLTMSGCSGSTACHRWDYDPGSAPAAADPRAALNAYVASAPGSPPQSGWGERGSDAARTFSSGPHWRIGVEQTGPGKWYVANASSCR